MGMLLWIWWCSSVYYQRFAAGVVVSPDWIIRYLLLVWWCQSAVAAHQYFHLSSFSLWELPLHLDFSFRFVLLLFSLFQIACPAVGGVGSWQLRTTLTATMLRKTIWDSLELIDLCHDLDWLVCLVFWAKDCLHLKKPGKAMSVSEVDFPGGIEATDGRHASCL